MNRMTPPPPMEKAPPPGDSTPKGKQYNPCEASDCVFNEGMMCVLEPRQVKIAKGGGCSVYEPAGEGMVPAEAEVKLPPTPPAQPPAPKPAPMATGGGGMSKPKPAPKKPDIKKVPPPRGGRY